LGVNPSNVPIKNIPASRHSINQWIKFFIGLVKILVVCDYPWCATSMEILVVCHFSAHDIKKQSRVSDGCASNKATPIAFSIPVPGATMEGESRDRWSLDVVRVQA
jgi:hypothetical protein